MFGQRPSFGGVSSSFGSFGTNTSSTGFGSTFGRPVFGTPQTTASTSFGTGTPTGSASLFGQNQTTGGGLFGTQPTGFGSTGGAFGTGGGLFGSSNTQTSTSGGLFGTTPATSGFNATQNQPRPFSFGTPTTSTAGTGTSLFGSGSATGGTSLFSSTIGQTPGTVVKYNPVTGTDTMTRSGVSQNIQTKIEVISAMKEYENRSLEELRVEDYLAGRKGPQQQGFGFGQIGQQNKFLSQPVTSSSWLTNTNTGGLFGAKPQENKPLFGTGQPTGFGATSTSGSSLFGSSTQSPFGQSTTSPATGFSFGQANQNKPSVGFSFGQTTSTPSIFGSSTNTQSGSTFGPTGFSFGNQTGGGLFGNQNKPAFGSTTTNLFANKPAGSTFGGFGSTVPMSSPFGTTNTSTGGLFGSANQNKTGFSLGTTSTGFGSGGTTFGTGGLFGSNANQPKPGGLTFGSAGGFGSNTSSAGFSFTQPNTGGGLFSNPQSGGSLFGSTNPNLNTGSTLGPCFGMNPLQPSLIGGQMNFNNNNVVNNNNINNLIKALTHNPFGTSSLLKSATMPTGKADELLNSPTSTSASNADPSKTSVADKTPTYVLPSGSVTALLKPKPLAGTNRSSSYTDDSKKNLLFAGLDDKNEPLSDDPFKLSTFPSVKKLNLKVFNKTGKNANPNNSTGQNTATNSIVSGNLNSGTSTSLTNIPTSPLLLETPNDRGPLTPIHENSPTPDIIKGRNNLKNLAVPNKVNHINDTITDLNLMNKPSSNDDVNISELEGNEVSKENISIFDPPSIEDIPDNSPVSSSPHPAGIKLSRAGYYTIPSLEDLGEMVDSDGACLVENFTVGRYGYGNICFQGITNVSGMDLDSCVFIVRKEVEVYPEGVTKPPSGEELNKPAFVTLDCVWPVDKSTHEVIKCQERLDAIGWPQYLEKQCLKMEATFVEYRPETGSWVFRVKHFSKYGLQDEENEPPTAHTAQMEAEPPLGGVIPPQKDVLSKASEAPPKTPLSLSNFASPIPMFGGRALNSQGPPALALTSPPPHTSTLPHLGAEVVVPSPIKKPIYLDFSSIEVQEDGIDSGQKETEESLLVYPLSPSAERLTLSSRAPPRAIQTLKSQLFFNEFDHEDKLDDDPQDFGQHLREKGEKRELTKKEVSDGGKKDSLFSAIGSSKKLLLGNSLHFETSSIDDVTSRGSPVTMETEKLKRGPLSPVIEIEQEESEALPSKVCLRDPRSEYELLSAAPDPYFEMGRELTLHLGQRIPLQESFVSNVPKGISDTASFMGRSFRVGWGPCLTFAQGSSVIMEHTSSSEGPENQQQDDVRSAGPVYLFGTQEASARLKYPEVTKSHSTERHSLRIEKVHLRKYLGNIASSGKVIDPVLESCLQKVLECSICTVPSVESRLEETTAETTLDIDSTPCPYFCPVKGIDLLHRLYLSAAQNEEDNSVLSSVFDLCRALWGKLDFYFPDLDGDSEYALEQARKEAVSVWLEEVSENVVAMETERALLGDGEDDYIDAVYSHLTARQIGKACEVCMEKDDYHLALLLSQACLGNETPRQIMSKQLSNWAWSGLDSHISMPRLTLFTLLGGMPTHQSSQGGVNNLVGLDWRRCLGVLMWYMCPTTASIAEVIAEYELAAGLSRYQEAAICEEPKPAYLTNEPQLDNVKVNNDVCFQLLKLYVDRSHPLETLLETSAYTSDPLDATVSWLLWCILQSLDYTLLSTVKANTLHTGMVALLESHGIWHWAVFVTLCIPDENKRKSDLMELLTRHLLVEGEDGCSDPFYREKEHFILKELQVPAPLVHKAKAIRAKSLHLIDEEAWYLIQAGEYNQAHAMILESVAPNAVINEDHEFLLSYLDEFLKKGVSKDVIDWQNGGDIYLAYLEVIQQVNELRKSRQPTASKIEKLRPRLLALCLRLNNLKCPTAVHRLCISEMSRMVVSVLRAIMSEDPDGVRVLAQQITSLPLTHECALEELNHITHQYLVTLSQNPMETA